MISVVVPTYNREDCLVAMLESINVQTTDLFEVIVVDQSEVVTARKVEKIRNACRNLSYYHIRPAGRSVSKNFAIGVAKGEVVLFCDDDIVVQNDFLETHLKLHKLHPEVGAISCRLVEEGDRFYKNRVPLKITRYGRFINRPNTDYEGYVTSLNGGNMSFKRSALDKVGFFEEGFRGTSMLEEPDIAYRLMRNNYKLYYSSLTQVAHFPQHNGNNSSKSSSRILWLQGYFFNQYYFLLRNRLHLYAPFVLAYLFFRSLVELLSGKVNMRVLALPVSAFLAAAKWWNHNKARYNKLWYTPAKTAVTVINLQTNIIVYER